jgi:hypothetical protein
LPVNIGLRSKPERMMSWVRSLVWVIQHGTCAGACRVAHEAEHRHRVQVAGLLLALAEVDGAAVDARRRAGLQPALRQLQLLQPADSETAGGSPRGRPA